MPSVDEALKGSEQEWLGSLAPHAQATIRELLSAGSDHEEVAATWLTQMGAKDVAFYGVEAKRSSFFESFKKELHEFLCGGDKKYQTERAALLKDMNKGHAFIVSTITAAIATHLGVAAAFLGPPVTMLILVISKAGLNAWCKAMTPPSGDNATPA